MKKHLSLVSICFATVALLLTCIGVQAGNIINIPIRWCVIDGTPAVTNPGGVGAASTDEVLMGRLQRLSDKIWCPKALIIFRSAMTAEVTDPNDRHFPIVTGSTADLDALFAKCEAAWDALGAKYNTKFVGPIAVNIPGTSCSGQGGWTYVSVASGGDVCRDPSKFTMAWGGRLVIADNQSGSPRCFDFDKEDKLLAHELGHVLKLEHGNGLDDNNNGTYESPSICGSSCISCEQSEESDDPDSALNTPFSLMRPYNNSAVITPLQRETARGVALVYSGAKTDPPGVLIDGDAIQDERVDPIRDVTDSSVDIVTTGFIENTANQTTLFYHKVIGPIPFLPTGKEYLLFLDLDNNPSTGGSPSALGFPTTFTGAELVTRVFVGFFGEFSEVTARVWRYQGGSFVEITDPLISPQVRATVDGDVHQRIFDSVLLTMPNSVRGPLSPGRTVRIQSIAHGLETAGQLDQLPDGPSHASANLFMVHPTFPVCNVTPGEAAPGTVANVQVSGLWTNETANVFLGGQLVASGQIDGSGNASVNFLIPTDATPGPRLISTSVAGTALASECPLVVAGVPNNLPTVVCPSPATNECSSAGVFVSLTAQVGDPDGDRLIVVWEVDGVAVQTNTVPRGAPPTSASVTLDQVYFKGTHVVKVSAYDGKAFPIECLTSVNIRDTLPPLIVCRPAPNPSSKKIPVSGKNPTSGQNPDGYYQLISRDACDPNPVVYVADNASSFVAGPFASGAIVKISQNPGGTPSSDPGNPPIMAHIHLKGDGLGYGVDADGNVSSTCLMLIPPDPK